MEIVGAGVEIIEQHGDGLGERIANLFIFLFEAGFTSVVVIGSDSPDLPMERIETAVALLSSSEQKSQQVVVGPAVDGGYYLIGMNGGVTGGLDEPQRELFKEIPWSTSEVLETTLKRAASAALEVTLIDEWHDIDTPEDLILLKENRDAPESARFALSCSVFER
ncbi:MAG: glycosyltransferase [Proteobacteria bacterium]|nr:glycosyltransferase [Pseudomonadota bacterium]